MSIWSYLRSLLTPLPVPSTDAEMHAAERDIELDALPESVRRARSMVGQGRYCLGAGGRDPAAARPFGPCAKPDVHTHEHAGPVFADCSGFVAWCVQHRRVVDVDPGPKRDDVWFYTDTLEADAGPRPIKGDLGDGVPWAQAEPGDLIVYGAGPKIGHVGIVSASDHTGPTKVIHCQASKTPAVVETSAALFKAKGAVILRLR